MQNYELVVLYHPDLEISLDKALKKVEGLVKDVKGKILFSDSWGKRKLAYPIEKQEYAIYVYYEIELPKDSPTTLERSLNITNEVIRYLVTKPTPNFGDREKHPMAEETSGEGEVDEDKPEEKEDTTAVSKETAGRKRKTKSVKDDSEKKSDVEEKSDG